MAENNGENTGKLTAPVQGGNPHLFQPGFDDRRGVGLKGVAGRPATAIRRAAQLGFAERIGVLMAIADGEPLPFTRRFKAKAGKRLPDGTICTKEQEEAGTIVEAKWEESADLDQRMKAVQMLGQFGGLATTVVVDDGESNRPKPVYEITFD